jgi:hypothetical protein
MTMTSPTPQIPPARIARYKDRVRRGISRDVPRLDQPPIVLRSSQIARLSPGSAKTISDVHFNNHLSAHDVLLHSPHLQRTILHNTGNSW